MTRSEVQVPDRPPLKDKLSCDLDAPCGGGQEGHLGDIAQMARAPALQAGGPGFESPCLHQILTDVNM
jgi:hypothetical protein